MFAQVGQLRPLSRRYEMGAAAAFGGGDPETRSVFAWTIHTNEGEQDVEHTKQQEKLR